MKPVEPNGLLHKLYRLVFPIRCQDGKHRWDQYSWELDFTRHVCDDCGALGHGTPVCVFTGFFGNFEYITPEDSIKVIEQGCIPLKEKV